MGLIGVFGVALDVTVHREWIDRKKETARHLPGRVRLPVKNAVPSPATRGSGGNAIHGVVAQIDAA
jgi:hypothetical protein